MLCIGDIVRIDEQAEFRSDVQLSAYDDAEGNIALLRSYLFSDNARKDNRSATPSRSPAEILGELIETYSHEKLPNRLVVIANYGHGKSHLALALANYFGKPADSPEMKIVLEKLRHAVNNPTRLGRYKAFKDGRGRFLVIRLRGDVRRSLREQFVLGLEQAFSENPETKGRQLPFWFDLAERFLQELNGDSRQQAEKYLEQFGTQVSLLLEEVRKKRESAHQHCIDLFKHLHYGVTPDFGGDLALKDAMRWLVAEYCGPGKLFGGVLVLFDEFSLYVLNQAQRSAAGELQDLLNGVDDHRGRALFLAFAQHDPITVAREVYQRGLQGQTQQESLERELTRLERKLSLYSVLESVIDSYLIQPEDVWQQFTRDRRVGGALFRATDVTLESFRKRYEDDLFWTTEQVQETLAKGCFPLHPMTTALLCNLQFQEEVAHLGTARTVLGFVRGELESRLSLPAIDESRSSYINWALPVGLVDYFGEALSLSRFRQYVKAKRTAADKLTAEQDAVLKALLLQEVAAIPKRGTAQVEMLAEMAGLTETQARKGLKELVAAQIILHNSYQHHYSFWSVDNDPYKLDRILDQHLKRQAIDWPLLVKASQEYLLPLSVDIQWGHSQDWQAPSYFLTRSFFTVSHLQKLVPTYAYDAKKGLIEGDRGCVLWLLAQDQSDILWFQEQAPRIFDSAFPGDHPLPVVAIIPAQPSPKLLEAWRRKKVLEDFTQAERKEVGLELHTVRLEQTKESIADDLDQLRIGSKFERLQGSSQSYLVPQAYRTTLKAMMKSSPSDALRKSYALAYQRAPIEFFTHLKLNSTHLKSAVKTLANLLRQNSKIISSQLSQGIPRDMCQKFLVGKWHLLDSSGHIKEPGNLRIKQAWDYLQGTFIAGKEIKVRDAVIPLFNPPYGYDYHTATLLFCAWYGHYLHDLELSANGRRVSNDSLDGWLAKDPKDFINRICHDTNATLKRRDRASIDREASEFIEKAGRNLKQPEAQEVLDWLKVYCQDKNGNQGLLAQANQAAERLAVALHAAREYDRAAKEIAGQMKAGKNSLTALVDVQGRISRLPATENVSFSEATANALRDEWLKSVEEAVDYQCAKLEALTSTTEVGLHRQKLTELNKQLQAANLTGPVLARVGSALATVDQKADELRSLEQEEGVRRAIDAIEPTASLPRLYEFQVQLEQMTNYSRPTMGLRDRKVELVKAEIHQLETVADELTDAVNRLDSVEAAVDWHNKCLRLHDRYVGTPYYDALAVAEKRAQELRLLFEEVRAIRGTPIKVPGEIRQVQERLGRLREVTAGKLSSEQQEILDKTEYLVLQQVAERLNEGERWLAQLEEKWKGGASAAEIKRQVEQAPRFLRPEAKARLDRLNTFVQAKLERDAVEQIEMEFRRIRDPNQRQRCLERLNQVHNELSGD
jgi:hypothetical protein